MAAVHAHDPNFHTICGIEECPRTYTNFFSFKKHLYRKHRDTLCLMSLPEEQTILDVTVDDYSDDTASPIVTEENERKQSAMFILKAKTIHKVSQLALNGLLDDISTMLTSKIENLQEGIQKFTSSMSKECQESIREMFKVSSPFMGLETQHFQEQYFVDKLGLLVCSLAISFLCQLIRSSTI